MWSYRYGSSPCAVPPSVSGLHFVLLLAREGVIVTLWRRFTAGGHDVVLHADSFFFPHSPGDGMHMGGVKVSAAAGEVDLTFLL